MMLSTDEKAQAFNPPPAVECPHCGKLLPIQGTEVPTSRGPQVAWFGPVKCECDGARKELERQKVAAAMERLKSIRAGVVSRIKAELGETGPGRRFATRTFANFDAEGDRLIMRQVAERFADLVMSAEIESEERSGLLITGPVGTGKTHLAAAVGNTLKAEGVPVVFLGSVELLDKIRETFDGSARQTEEKVLHIYKTVDLLVIDDLGKEKPTEWAASKLFQIINARYEELKPIIITTNYTLEELKDRLTPKGGDGMTAEAIVDRLREMVFTLPLGGQSRR